MVGQCQSVNVSTSKIIGNLDFSLDLAYFLIQVEGVPAPPTEQVTPAL